MALSFLQLITLVLVALLLGTTFAHALEMAPKMRADGPEWLALQRSLYARFATIGGGVEFGATIASVVLTVAERGESTRLLLAATASALLVLAFAVVWVGFTHPVNVRTASWTTSSLPTDWMRWRAQWEYSHLVRFVLHLIAFVALAAMVTSVPR